MTHDSHGPRIQKPLRAVAAFRRRLVRITEQMRVRQTVIYANLAVLSERYGPPPGLAGRELKVFSQNGEDGVLAEVFFRIGTDSRWFVEFGIGAGLEGNSVLLADVHGWSGLFIEGAEELHNQLAYKYAAIERVSTRHAVVTAENIERLMEDASVPKVFDVLTIDIDGNDYWVWNAIRSHRPRVVVCEYNGSLDPTVSCVQPYTPHLGWDSTEFFGASLTALVQLGRQKGYTLVYTDLTGTNAFFVLDEYATEFEDCFPVSARRAVPALTDFSHRPARPGRSYEPASGDQRREDRVAEQPVLRRRFVRRPPLRPRFPGGGE